VLDSMVVISSCTARKRTHSTANASLASSSVQPTPAKDLYTGKHHILVMSAVNDLRLAFPDNNIRFFIISAGHGVLSEHEAIMPYDASFNQYNIRDAINRARMLKIRKKLQGIMMSASAGFFVVGQRYLRAVEGPIGCAPLEIYLTARGVLTAAYAPGIVWIPAGADMARQLRVSPRVIGATMFRKAVDRIVKDRTLRRDGPSRERTLSTTLMDALQSMSGTAT